MTSDDLRAEYEKCRKRYPTIDLSFEDFLARAEGSGPESAHLCCEDLFLATACARGDRIAWEYFADEYLPLVRGMAARACRQLMESEDLAQELVAGLISDRTRLGGYSGRGSLAGWLRVAISHAAIDRFRRRKREVPLDESGGEVPKTELANRASETQETSPDASWGPVLAEVLQEQIRSLAPRERIILGLYYADNVPLKLIGRQFGVHEATVSRWLDTLRQTIRKRVERELRARYGLKAGEVQGIWQWAAGHELFKLAEVVASGRDPRDCAGPEAKTPSLEGKV